MSEVLFAVSVSDAAGMTDGSCFCICSVKRLSFHDQLF